jgi:SAM-dependent methyltransferase
VLITDFFDYKPLEIIKKYLLELLNVLRPGGVIMFTYNNCELPEAIKNVELRLSSYLPKRYIIPFIESIGYEVLYSNNKNNISWVEIKKEGTMTSLRGGQALAQIKD